MGLSLLELAMRDETLRYSNAGLDSGEKTLLPAAIKIDCGVINEGLDYLKKLDKLINHRGFVSIFCPGHVGECTESQREETSSGIHFYYYIYPVIGNAPKTYGAIKKQLSGVKGWLKKEKFEYEEIFPNILEE
ncbi:hypothetical protein HN832_03390 [archaeon]|jgi:hypothetical protein|nr:hypothetical protein [archaeon]MBT4373559.1 hypothetical protein [archaeon]MBT4532007.1 hypothetical protein [archaeon]MBT7001674.1 hypothetical protein [archaeon]MBT7282434.1 hypothetical protein [archaeon]